MDEPIEIEHLSGLNQEKSLVNIIDMEKNLKIPLRVCQVVYTIIAFLVIS
jgi:hypothetical protein